MDLLPGPHRDGLFLLLGRIEIGVKRSLPNATQCWQGFMACQTGRFWIPLRVSVRAVVLERRPCGVSCPAEQSPENVPNKAPVPNWENPGSFWDQ